MCSDIVISVRNVSKCYHIYDTPRDRFKQLLFRKKHYYREFWALRDVGFELRKGETIGIIGRNGSGKSTLLQVICGTLTPTTGAVEVKGRVAALLELGAGFNPEFSGRENVYMNASLLGLSESEIDARYDDIVAFADIGSFIEQPVKTYSSGMFVRLAFAVIAHVDANVLIIDEALAVGDAFFTQKCMRFLRRFREHGALLFVSHDIAAVMSLCSQALWLDKGCVRDVGDAKSVSEQYLAALFGSDNKAAAPAGKAIDATEHWRDQRLSFVNASNLRNDLEVFRFTEHRSESFGQGAARIVDVTLVDDDGIPFAWVVGGEHVRLLIRIDVLDDLASPIVGFYVKDRLGQALFGDNTWLTYALCPRRTEAGSSLVACFRFPMPVLPVGEYSIAVAIADGTQEEHVQHHWIHDALVFRSHSSMAATGLVGIPMLEITLNVPSV